MKYIFLTAIISVLLSSSACKKSKTSNCSELDLNCSAVLCPAIADWRNFDFKLIDKVSGKDLVFGSNPRYIPSDIKLFFDAALTSQINITIDMANKKFSCMTAKNEMYLEMKGTAVYKLNAGFKAESCCNARVKSLQVNNIVVCDCCANIINVPVD